MGAVKAMAQAANGNAGAPAAAPVAAPAVAPISRDAQRAYEDARDKLVQIRTVLRTSDSQSSTGSGFFVSADGLIITNFHVASQLALEPDRYRAVVVAVDGKEAPVQLLAFDLRHDLALLRVEKPVAGQGALAFRDRATPLARGERIFSLGNPRDIGFAVTEGAYNGLAQRSFYPRIFFGGTVNPGMSGGPVLDDHGRVVGVNVSKRRDGEQLSFLIPAEFAQALLDRAKDAKPQTKAAHPEVTRQLLEHQEEMTRRFTGTPLKGQRHNGYLVPVPPDSLARAAGAASATPTSRPSIWNAPTANLTAICSPARPPPATSSCAMRVTTRRGWGPCALPACMRKVLPTRISQFRARARCLGLNAMSASSIATAWPCAPSYAPMPTASCPVCTTCRCWWPR